MKKILILAANPRQDLNLDSEIRDLRKVIEHSPKREDFSVIDALAVPVGDLQELMLKHEPQIVHFCGHGSGEQGLVFEGEKDGEQLVDTDALSGLFRLFDRSVECVLLNACYSEPQANAIVEHINYVIGMNQAIRDDAAIAFSKGFYRALGYERPIEEAYEFGRNAIQLQISGSSKMRSAATEAQRKMVVIETVKNTVIPEHLKPILKRKQALTSLNPTISPEMQTTIQLDIDKSLEADSKVKQFRDRVRFYLEDRKLSEIELIRLEQLQEELGLSLHEAERILEEEQAPINKSRQNYRDLLNKLIARGRYPFNSRIQDELKNCQQEEKLTDEEVEEISTPILETAEATHQEKLRQQAQQDYQANLQRYEQEFRRVITAGYPIEETVLAGLRSFQQSLGLRDGDVTRIEQPLIVPKEAEYQRLRQQAQQEYQAKLQRYEQAVRQAVEAGYPLADGVRNQLTALQRSLELQAEDVADIERPILQVANAVYQERQRQEKGVLQFQRFKFEVITADDKGKETNRTIEQAEYFSEKLGNRVTLDMVKVPGGTFQMGSSESNESPRHPVKVSPFLMGKYPVTQAQWRVVAAFQKVDRDLNPDPSRFKGDNRPVEQVSWHEAVEFCKRLSQETGRAYRLPSEAEWEYACRAGTTTDFYFGPTLTPDLAQCKSNLGMAVLTIFSGQTAVVGSYFPNKFGLYDMHGNVWEWCADHWHGNYDGAPSDGGAWVTGGNADRRVMRGGSWGNYPSHCRSAYRYYYNPVNQNVSIGFRVVCGMA
jgi:formylglycine-generating enzyme required for sulfatase activity